MIVLVIDTDVLHAPGGWKDDRHELAHRLARLRATVCLKGIVRQPLGPHEQQECITKRIEDATGMKVCKIQTAERNGNEEHQRFANAFSRNRAGMAAC